MEPDKNKSPAPEDGSKEDDKQAPADALSRTPEELDQEKAEQAAAHPESSTPKEPAEKKVSPIKKFLRKINLYFLIFLLIVVIAGAYMIVTYLNSQKTTPPPNIASQELTESALKQLANTDATVGGTGQTFTIQGNTVVAGQTLMRGNLNVAGNFQTGGSIQGPSLTISGTSNLGTAQVNSLQVAQNTAIQGSTTLRDLSVSGTTSLSGPVTVSQITVSRLIMSGNAVLQIPNHIAFTGPAPNRNITANVLGNGGTATVNGSDTTGTVNVNTGNNPKAGCFVKITFNQAFTTQPHVLVSPIGAGAGQSEYYVNRTNNFFEICSANIPPANQAFGYDYFVTG